MANKVPSYGHIRHDLPNPIHSITDDASEDSLDGDGRGSAVDEDPYVIDEEEYRIMEEKRFNLIESMRTIEEK